MSCLFSPLSSQNVRESIYDGKEKKKGFNNFRQKYRGNICVGERPGERERERERADPSHHHSMAQVNSSPCSSLLAALAATPYALLHGYYLIS
jgi:hypothetical protein